MKKNLIAMILACAMVIFGFTLASSPANAVVGDSPSNPIVVSAVTDVPAGAVEDNPSTYNTATLPCDVTRSWVHTKPGTAEVSHNEWTAEQRSRTYTPAQQEVKEYTYDKFVQRQKAKWNGNTYVGPISAGYPGSYTWRDAGFANVTNTTGVTPTAPGPVRGEFIHNNGGTWYFTLFYEYRLISTRVVTAATPATYGPWSAWTAYGTNPYLSEPVLPANTHVKEYRKFGPVVVVDSAATPPVVTYYGWSDGKVCEVVTPTPTPTPTVTPTPTPTPTPTVTPTPDVVKPAASIRSACTGNVGYSFDNTKSNKTVTYKYLLNGKVKKNKVRAFDSEFFVKKAKAHSLAWIKAKGVFVSTRVPGNCIVPHSGARK